MALAFPRDMSQPHPCDICGELARLRPYGPNDKELICLECAMREGWIRSKAEHGDLTEED